ncbi:MAG: virulence protein RhuM/Fic/DOC family protein [Patescibacteria group bacterium]
MPNKKISKNVVIYQAKSGAIELRGDLRQRTIWATQTQIVNLFGVDQSVVSRHINNIFKDGEISKKSNMQKTHIANSDKPVAFYSLDMILGVGYRTNSKVAIEFRKWATKILREYIVDGYVVNKNRIAKNYNQFLSAVEDVKKLLPAGTAINANDAIELISLFADTWFSLNAYDKEIFIGKSVTKKSVALTADKLTTNLAELKKELIKKGEATELFGSERSRGSIEGIVGSVMQSFGGKELYKSVEEKAAHLLYFTVKNHPFVDGNKRSGAYFFVWFLRQAKILDIARFSPAALTAVTIFVAESNPKHKEKVVKLVLNLISKN